MQYRNAGIGAEMVILALQLTAMQMQWSTNKALDVTFSKPYQNWFNKWIIHDNNLSETI